jgi:transposase InsO family protein
VRVSPRTVYGWWRCFRLGGIEALRPKRRKDHGQSRVLEAKLLERAAALRKENPKRTTTTLLDILVLEQHFAQRNAPHRATLDRHLARRGASRRQMKVLATAPTIRLHFEHFGDLWLGDYHHGPLVLGPDGQPATSKLGAFLDHASRYPVADRYYLAEDLATLRDSLLRALLRWGPSEKVYVDRGAVYRSDQLAYSLQRIGTQLVHSRAYYSQGRGAIERWWQTIAAFEDEVAARPELLTLHELNRLWEAYRERRYCEVRHSSLGCSPKEAVADVTPRPLDPQLARELF